MLLHEQLLLPGRAWQGVSTPCVGADCGVVGWKRPPREGRGYQHRPRLAGHNLLLLLLLGGVQGKERAVALSVSKVPCGLAMGAHVGPQDGTGDQTIGSPQSVVEHLGHGSSVGAAELAALHPRGRLAVQLTEGESFTSQQRAGY